YSSFVLVSDSLVVFFLCWYAHHRVLHSFPTRRSSDLDVDADQSGVPAGLRGRELTFQGLSGVAAMVGFGIRIGRAKPGQRLHGRSEEHTSELQSRENLVCRLLLEKKKT